MAASDQRKLQKRAIIIAAASRIFIRKGYFRTVMADIAVEAGIGKGTLYEYFASKEALFFAVFESAIADMTAKMAACLEERGSGAGDRLLRLSNQIVPEWTQDIELFTLVMEFWAVSGASPGRQEFRAFFRRSYEEFRRLLGAIIAEGVASGEFRPDVDVDSVSAGLVGVWDSLLLQAWLDPEFDAQRHASRFLDDLRQGLAP